MSRFVRRDTVRYVLPIVGGVVIAVVSGLVGLLTDSAAQIPKLAIENYSEVSQTLSASPTTDRIELEGSFAFAGFMWFLILALTLFALMFYYRSLAIQEMRTKLQDASAVLLERASTIDKQNVLIQNMRTESQASVAERARLQEALDHATRRTPESELYLVEYNELVARCKTLVDRLLGSETTHFRYTRITETTVLSADGTADVDRDYDVEAYIEGARFWRLRVFADDAAKKLDFASHMAFRARTVAEANGESLLCIPTINDPLEKRFAVCFDPPAPKGSQRRFKVSYRWPQFAADLITKGETSFFVSYTSADDTDTAIVTYTLKIPKSLGKVQCNARSLPEGGILVPDHSDEFWGWRFEANNLALKGAKLELSVVKVTTLDQ